MTARLLTTLALALPLAACAAQPGPGQAAGRPADAAPAVTTAAGQETQRAAAPVTTAPVTTAPAAAPEPAAAPAPAATRQVPPATSVTPAQPRAATGTGAPSAAAPAAANPQAAAVPDTATAPAVTTAPATAPDVAAPRPAPGTAVPQVAMPAGSSTGSLLQTLFALILVLAVLGALAWFLKRYGPKVSGGNANVRVVGSLSLGGRERIVVVEVGNEWIVVGASPGRINALATMPRQDGQNGDTGGANSTLAPHAPAAHSFADWLKQTIDKRK
jgi:flagellar biosynthetic protein FliO